MPAELAASLTLKFEPLTAERWPDLEALFGPRGACGGCWCMFWRLSGSQFEQRKGQTNKETFQELVASGEGPGLLAYAAGQPIGWCAIAPRENYGRLARSRVLKEVDDQPVWSVVCFFVTKSFRHKGVTVELLKAAVSYAKQQGARIIEGYPVEPNRGNIPDVFAYTGIPSAFRKAGFVEVIRRSEVRPIMRYYCQGGKHAPG